MSKKTRQLSLNNNKKNEQSQHLPKNGNAATARF
jgi:hypothetical protein